MADRGVACGLRLAALGLESQHWANRSDCRKPHAAQQCLSQSPGGAPHRSFDLVFFQPTEIFAVLLPFDSLMSLAQTVVGECPLLAGFSRE